jgi:16S rRNA (cytidine1402-2'-O)-methyltransferase
VRGDLGSIDIGEPRGEYVIVLGGAPRVEPESDEATIRRAIEAELDAGATTRDAATVVSARLGVPKRTVYALATEIGSHRRAT